MTKCISITANIPPMMTEDEAMRAVELGLLAMGASISDGCDCVFFDKDESPAVVPESTFNEDDFIPLFEDEVLEQWFFDENDDAVCVCDECDCEDALSAEDAVFDIINNYDMCAARCNANMFSALSEHADIARTLGLTYGLHRSGQSFGSAYHKAMAKISGNLKWLNEHYDEMSVDQRERVSELSEQAHNRSLATVLCRLADTDWAECADFMPMTVNLVMFGEVLRTTCADAVLAIRGTLDGSSFNVALDVIDAVEQGASGLYDLSDQIELFRKGVI